MLGTPISMAFKASSISPRVLSRALILSATSFISAMTAEVSSPAFFILGIWAETWFRRAFRASTCCISSRRFSSRANNSVTSAPLFRRLRMASRNASGLLRMRLISNMLPYPPVCKMGLCFFKQQPTGLHPLRGLEPHQV